MNYVLFFFVFKDYIANITYWLSSFLSHGFAENPEKRHDKFRVTSIQQRGANCGGPRRRALRNCEKLVKLRHGKLFRGNELTPWSRVLEKLTVISLSAFQKKYIYIRDFIVGISTANRELNMWGMTEVILDILKTITSSFI
jgi:hypothetical protein